VIVSYVTETAEEVENFSGKKTHSERYPKRIDLQEANQGVKAPNKASARDISTR
jgi:hypothetical protein